MSGKLDLSGVRIYSNTKHDIIDALDLIGEEVFLSDYADFRSYVKAKLAGVTYTEDNYRPFFHRGENPNLCEYKYFILAKVVKFKDDEKTYKIFRPYKSIDEFWNETGCEGVGLDCIIIRNKRRKQECVLLYTGYSEDAVHLGGYVLTFETLVKHYEFYNKCGEWKPFGVEE